MQVTSARTGRQRDDDRGSDRVAESASDPGNDADIDFGMIAGASGRALAGLKAR
jgi:hypothetical protein